MFSDEVKKESFNISVDEKLLLQDLMNDKITIEEYVKLSKEYFMNDQEKVILNLIAMKKKAIRDLMRDEFTVTNHSKVTNETMSVDQKMANGSWGAR